MKHKRSTDFTRYKFKSLKTYTSTEWLADSKKKYRQVFDRSETSYIFAELVFFNKLFDEEDWEAQINLKAFQRTDSTEEPLREICDIELVKHVTVDLNTVPIREGWGVDRLGEFWSEGSYYWEAFIDGELVATRDFYIYDVGEVAIEANPYFDVEAARLYEGGRADGEALDRLYGSTFHDKETRFIWVEFRSKNKLDRPWKTELVFNFYNDARQLKGCTTELINVAQGQESITINSGWGSDHKGTWFADNYTVEIVFMDTLIGIVPFRVGDHFAEGDNQLLRPDETNGTLIGAPVAEEKEEKTLEELLEELDGMIGLTEIKTRIREYSQYLNFLKLRKERGFTDQNPSDLHVVFTGNPGTGKTTVARMLGKIYQKLGLLNRGHVHEVDRADIIGEYIGQTAPKMRAAIDKARGGVLFIDEAYALVRTDEDKKDYGREAVEILVKELSAPTVDFALIVAGYPKEMEQFLRSNPGLKSRLTMRFDFPDYTPDELLEICALGADHRQVELAKPAKDYLHKKLTEAFRNRDRSFGNARYALSLVNEAKMNMGLRVMGSQAPQDLDKAALSLILEDDIKEIFEPKRRLKLRLPVDEELLAEATAELNQLIGLENVKAEVLDLVKLVRFYKEIGKDVLHRFSLHSVFTGNPGTGKTTVARILGKIYRALGILEKGSIIEADRSVLVAEYVGQTAKKTAEIIEKAKGGVLFIDEAYALVHATGQDFGKEAIDTLLKRMEDLRGELIVIVAGYPEPMKRFLESNPGLKSRFDRKFVFSDYAPEELMAISSLMLKEEGIEFTPEAGEHLAQYFRHLYRTRNKFFGNARAVRKVVEKAIKNQHLRLAKMSHDQRTPDMLRQLTLGDVKEFTPDNDSLLEGGSQGRVGYL